MLHNLLITYRNFKRSKGSFFINLIGLSSGIACVLFIYLWVKDEIDFDKFHKKNSQLFQVMQNQKTANNITTWENTPGPLAEALIEEMPEIEYAVPVFNGAIFGKPTLSVKENNFKANGIYAGKDFFNIFTFNLIEGNANQVLADKNSVVLSEGLAMKLFNTTEKIVGKTVKYQNEQTFQVSGIFKRVPSNSSLQFDFVLSYKVISERINFFSTWGDNPANTYIILKQGTNINQFNNKIAGLIKRKSGDDSRILFLRPYSNKYLYDRYENGLQMGGRIEYVKLFSIIAFFILVIACINFMNLSTARASRRIKEIGMKKALGAGRKSIILQHLGESILIAFISLIIAILLVWLLLPLFNDIAQKHITINLNSFLVLVLLGITLFTGLIAGSYPALYLSGFNPVKVLKGQFHSSVGELWVRKGLVVFQFVLSIILIVSVLVVYKQSEFIQNKKLGYNKDNILYFDIEGKVAVNRVAFLEEVKKIPGVLNASSATAILIGSLGATPYFDWPGKNPNDIVNFSMQYVDYGFIEMHDIEMKEGRSFSKDFSTDSSNIIFNEAAIKIMGIKEPVGKIITLWGGNRQIIGVTKDFNFESLHNRVKPLAFILARPEWNSKIVVKIKDEKEKETISSLEKFYEKYNPGFVFEYKFLDEDYQAQYVAEKRVTVLSQYFAGLAILISCLGLFGLAAFTAEKRIKEIGIRKINGAKVTEIIAILNIDLIKWVTIAFVIACPIAWFTMHKWLESFDYRTELSWWVFALAGLMAMIIALLTVSWQSWRASTKNPVEALRYE
jgi:putative ABC transport system permease protein